MARLARDRRRLPRRLDRPNPSAWFPNLSADRDGEPEPVGRLSEPNHGERLPRPNLSPSEPVTVGGTVEAGRGKLDAANLSAVVPVVRLSEPKLNLSEPKLNLSEPKLNLSEPKLT